MGGTVETSGSGSSVGPGHHRAAFAHTLCGMVECLSAAGMRWTVGCGRGQRLSLPLGKGKETVPLESNKVRRSKSASPAE